MPAFFDLLTQETDPAVGVVLGHFVFAYIHPYMDGNGRMARFLMNLMMAASGYPWVVIPLAERELHGSPEKASVRGYCAVRRYACDSCGKTPGGRSASGCSEEVNLKPSSPHRLSEKDRE